MNFVHVRIVSFEIEFCVGYATNRRTTLLTISVAKYLSWARVNLLGSSHSCICAHALLRALLLNLLVCGRSVRVSMLCFSLCV